MRRIIKHVALVVPALTTTTTHVSAHAGHHSEPTISSVIQHLVSSPYHMGLIIGVSLLAIVVWRKRTKKQNNSRSN